MRTRLYSRWTGGTAFRGDLRYAITIVLDRILDWPDALDALAPILEEYQTMTPFILAPLRHGRPVRELSNQFIRSMLPARDDYDPWMDFLPEPYPTPLASSLQQAQQAIRGLSAVGEVVRLRGELQVHADVAERLSAQLREALESEPISDGAASALEVVQHLGDLLRRLAAELDGSQREGETIAADFAKACIGDVTPEFETLILALWHAFEIDVSAAVTP